jgi:O-antigen/teichoic acid export membrane protein
MRPADRLVINTGAQYIRTIVNILLSLYSTRLILSILGAEDYGIYTLIAGVISMLSFVTNALVVTTQRFLSFYQGKGDVFEVKKIFSNSLILHLIIGVLFVIIIELTGLFLFDGFLNIPQARVDAAKQIFHFTVLILLLNFITAPFRALIISRENIVYVSIIDVIDGILKVVIALILPFLTYDSLVGYGLLLSIIFIFNLFAHAIYSFKKYEECIIPELNHLSRSKVLELVSFAGWTIYNIGGVIIRTQGIAILLNKYISTIINASYGLAIQISGSVSFLSLSLLNAINPQIMKSEGEGNRQKMIRLSEMASKFSLFLMSLFVIPAIFEMPALMSLWLKDVPEKTVFFTRMILIASIFDQLTLGLGSAIQATGNIKKYSLAVNTLKMVTLPTAIICLKLGLGVNSVMYCFILFELLCATIRLPFVRINTGLSYSSFLNKVVKKEIIPIMVLIVGCCLIVYLFDFRFRFVLTFFVSIILFIPSIYFGGLCYDEKIYANDIIKSLRQKIIIIN